MTPNSRPRRRSDRLQAWRYDLVMTDVRKGREELRRGAGGQFDPDLVPVFERVIGDLAAPAA